MTKFGIRRDKSRLVPPPPPLLRTVPLRRNRCWGVTSAASAICLGTRTLMRLLASCTSTAACTLLCSWPHQGARLTQLPLPAPAAAAARKAQQHPAALQPHHPLPHHHQHPPPLLHQVVSLIRSITRLARTPPQPGVHTPTPTPTHTHWP